MFLRVMIGLFSLLFGWIACNDGVVLYVFGGLVLGLPFCCFFGGIGLIVGSLSMFFGWHWFKDALMMELFLCGFCWIKMD